MIFSDLGLKDEIQKAIQDLGFTEPTPIQQETYSKILAGR